MAITAEGVVAAFVKIRDRRNELKKAWEEQDVGLKQQQEKLELWLLKNLEKLGAESVKTASGTAYKQIKLRASPADFDLAFNWAAEHNAPDLFEKRVSAAFVKTYMEEHNGELPSGIDIFRETVVSIRRG